MRKWYSVVFASVLLILLLTGCADPSSRENKQSLAQTDTTASETTDKRVPMVSANDKTTSNSAQISRDEAKRIALEKAGVTMDSIFDYECELDYDEDTRVWEYEISFNVGRTEFECDIHAEDGTIIHFRTEFDD